ncbi:Alpha-1,3-mannosyl-glycoprotein 4-beta-N-acetylglucosaminyltransferase C [Desmophyllum pertusum]|uniref:Alpha-1,3-mannosyl-glycoprotein 4-beta-N-acetylglucosaminyltransferase C n=1 Tax=Desmophyllum pertusum TaxID=174260 RepID=A0A9W9Z9P0_9CNID|nr:Alpha-1,3-mannosyl-glycoprotein 4-beta-N-acetylglucosaminyltransferase C [Desmophyllum pertusum]
MNCIRRLNRRQLPMKLVLLLMTTGYIFVAFILAAHCREDPSSGHAIAKTLEPKPQNCTKFQDYLSREQSNSLCPRNEVLRSSKVNRLGKYPQKYRHLTIGITSISRPAGANYLIQTIQSLLESMNDAERNQAFIVVFLADFDETLKMATANTLSELFHKEIEEDFLHVIEAFPQYYPKLSKLKVKFGDSQDRTKWRSKQNIDFAFLMCYCQDLSHYYLHVEDDVTASPSLFGKLNDFMKSQTKPWPMLDLSAMGHVAKIYYSKDLGNIASYFYLMYDEMPVDWLIEHWRKIKGGDQLILPAASFFEHEGKRSSLSENKLRDEAKYFDLYDHKYKGLNPPASLFSSISSNIGQPQEAYTSGIGYFWGKHVQINGSVTVRFDSVVNVKQVFVDTGSNLALKDWLKVGVLQASFVSTQSHNPVSRENISSNCENFETIAPFVKGKANITLTNSQGIECLRILVTQNQAQWLFLREIDVWQE